MLKAKFTTKASVFTSTSTWSKRKIKACTRSTSWISCLQHKNTLAVSSTAVQLIVQNRVLVQTWSQRSWSHALVPPSWVLHSGCTWHHQVRLHLQCWPNDIKEVLNWSIFLQDVMHDVWLGYVLNFIYRLYITKNANKCYRRCNRRQQELCLWRNTL